MARHGANALEHGGVPDALAFNRSTSRSRVRADVMPMPLRVIGRSSERPFHRKRSPARDFRDRRVCREVDLDRRTRTRSPRPIA
jgi:hypothetical protein